MPVKSPAEVTAIAVSFDHQLSDGRILRFHTGIAEDASAEELNALLDRLTAASDRQAARYKLQALQADLVKNERMYQERAEDVIRIDAEAEAAYGRSNRKVPWSPDQLTPKQKQDRDNVAIMGKRLKEMILEQRGEIAQLQQVVNGAAHSAADRH